jgi:hypothetical protein
MLAGPTLSNNAEPRHSRAGVDRPSVLSFWPVRRKATNSRCVEHFPGRSANGASSTLSAPILNCFPTARMAGLDEPRGKLTPCAAALAARTMPVETTLIEGPIDP